MKLINLLPKEEQRELKLEQASKSFLEFWISVVSSLVVLFVITMFAIIYLNSNIKATEFLIFESQAVLNSSDYKDLQVEISEINGKVKEIENMKKQHLYPSKALLALAQLIPSNVQLNQTTVNRETGQVDIVGQAQTRDSVIAIWSNILKSEYFENINFPLKNLEKANFANFTFTFFIDKTKIQQP